MLFCKKVTGKLLNMANDLAIMGNILFEAGRYDEAINKLEFLLQRNGNLSVELLKRDPFWDPLRDINEFKELIENPRYQLSL